MEGCNSLGRSCSFSEGVTTGAAFSTCPGGALPTLLTQQRFETLSGQVSMWADGWRLCPSDSFSRMWRGTNCWKEECQEWQQSVALTRLARGCLLDASSSGEGGAIRFGKEKAVVQIRAEETGYSIGFQQGRKEGHLETNFRDEFSVSWKNNDFYRALTLKKTEEELLLSLERDGKKMELKCDSLVRQEGPLEGNSATIGKVDCSLRGLSELFPSVAVKLTVKEEVSCREGARIHQFDVRKFGLSFGSLTLRQGPGRHVALEGTFFKNPLTGSVAWGGQAECDRTDDGTRCQAEIKAPERRFTGDFESSCCGKLGCESVLSGFDQEPTLSSEINQKELRLRVNVTDVPTGVSQLEMELQSKPEEREWQGGFFLESRDVAAPSYEMSLHLEAAVTKDLGQLSRLEAGYVKRDGEQ